MSSKLVFVGLRHNGNPKQGHWEKDGKKIEYLYKYIKYPDKAILIHDNNEVKIEAKMRHMAYPYNGKQYNLPNNTLVYHGDFNDDFKYHGKGILYSNNGTKLYDGEWVNGQYNGIGTEYYETGEIQYKGLFFKGMWHNSGTKYDKKGNLIYGGVFKKNKYNGYGILYTKKGVYVGFFKNNLFHGKGKFADLDNITVYVGNYANGKRNGLGTSYYDSKQIEYEGFWINGKFGDKGKLYERNGDLRYEGYWKHGQYHGKGKIYLKGYLLYDGVCNMGLYEGFVNLPGKLYFNNTNVLKRSIVEDKNKIILKTYYDDIGLLKSHIIINKSEVYWNCSKTIINKFYNQSGVFYHRNGEIKFVGLVNFETSKYFSWLLQQFDYSKGTLYNENKKPIFKGTFRNYYKQPKYLKGTLYYHNSEYIGTFQQNKLNSPDGLIIYANGSFYKGNVKDNQKHLFGVLYSKNFKIINAGYWLEDLFDETKNIEDKQLIDEKYSYYIGQWGKNYQYNGNGKLYDAKKRLIKSGKFKSGKLFNGKKYVYSHNKQEYYEIIVKEYQDQTSVNKDKFYYDFSGTAVRFGTYINNEFIGFEI